MRTFMTANTPILKFGSCILAVMLIFTVASALEAKAQEVLSNEKVVEMHKLGFSSAMIISKIRSSQGKYDTSIDAMSALKKAGIHEDVIMAMMDATSKSTGTTSSHATTVGGTTVVSTSNRKLGIFWAKQVGNTTELVEVEPTVFKKAKSGGFFKTAVTYGIAKSNIKVVFPGANSALKIPMGQPVFLFHTNESPKNYSMVKLEEKQKDRRIVVGEGNAFSYETGISDSVIIPVDVEKLEDGVYRVTPKMSLRNGEYAIFYGSDSTKAYDFGIRMIP